MTNKQSCDKMSNEKDNELRKLLRILWRLSKLAYILLGKEFGFEQPDK